MRSVAELKSFTREAARILARDKDLASYEIYCATAEHRIARLAYTSDIPSRGLEEFKSLHADGFQLRVAMRRDPHEIGVAFEAGDFTSDSVRTAIRRATELELYVRGDRRRASRHCEWLLVRLARGFERSAGRRLTL